jgi:preprotein translocase subunit SecB
MADQGNVLTDLNLGDGPAPQGGNGADTQPVAGFISQYIKDLSVENPRAPESFQLTEQPQLDVQFNIAARKISDEVTEVELKIAVTAKAGTVTTYIIELSYCGLVGMRNMSEEHMHAFTYAEAPRILFPFARQIVANAVREAGFAPLLLDPIDFNTLYVQQLQQQKQQVTGGEMPAPGAEG